ncbi:MAG: hypothetical protein GC187_02335 [Alphaproteobacteria bacterium]|nr:hypothetical protein [Alphaproteobacteria bacterium]
MTLAPRIETYLNELGRGLAALGERERADILMEARSHLTERAARVGEAEALRRMGPASLLAGRYIAATARPGAPQDAAPVRRLAPLVSAMMLVSAGILWVCTVISLTLCLAELAEPSLVSIWLSAGTGNIFVGAAHPDMVALLTDLAGPWFLPLAALLAALAGASAFAMMRAGWRDMRHGRRLSARSSAH